MSGKAKRTRTFLDAERAGDKKVPRNVKNATCTVDEPRSANGTPQNQREYFWASIRDWEAMRVQVKYMLAEVRSLMHIVERRNMAAHEDYRSFCEIEKMEEEEAKEDKDYIPE